MLKYISTEKNFRQYQPPETGWQRFKKFFKRKKQEKELGNPPVRQAELQNPYRRQRKERGFFSIKLKLFLLLLLILSWVVLAVSLPYFRIQKITYYGLRIIKKEEIDNFINQNYLTGWKVIPRSNYFVASTDKIAEMLNQKYSLLSVTVTKKFPNQLVVDLEEKNSSIIYDNGSQYYLLDGEGNAIKFLQDSTSASPCPNSLVQQNISESLTADNSTSSPSNIKVIHTPSYATLRNQFGDYTVLYDTRCITVTEKQEKIIPQNIIQVANDLRNRLAKEGIAIRYFSLDEPLAGFKAFTDKNYYIYFQPQLDLDSQLQNLKTILKNEKPTEYIDVRFGDRVYWK